MSCDRLSERKFPGNSESKRETAQVRGRSRQQRAGEQTDAEAGQRPHARVHEPVQVGPVLDVGEGGDAPAEEAAPEEAPAAEAPAEGDADAETKE